MSVVCMYGVPNTTGTLNEKLFFLILGMVLSEKGFSFVIPFDVQKKEKKKKKQILRRHILIRDVIEHM